MSNVDEELAQLEAELDEEENLEKKEKEQKRIEAKKSLKRQKN